MTSPAADPAGAIVFTDIVGFTELTDLHGDDAALALVDEQLAIVRHALPSGARIVKELGDGLMLWFDDAADAIETALHLQRHFTSACVGEMPLWVRIGMHWGTPKRRGDDIIGRDVNLASRVSDLAGAGEVVVTDRLIEAAGGSAAFHDVAFESLGSVFVKGFVDPVPVSLAASTGAGGPDLMLDREFDQDRGQPAGSDRTEDAACASAE